MTTKLLLEYSFVIFLLQMFKLKTYFMPLHIRQEKYNSERESLNKLLSKNTMNKSVILVSGIFSLVYIVFYLIGYELFKGTNVVYIFILMIILVIYGFIRVVINIRSDKLKENIIDKISQPITTAYLIYFVYYVLK